MAPKKKLKGEKATKKSGFSPDSPYMITESFKDGLQHYSHTTEQNAKVIANHDSGFPGGHGPDANEKTGLNSSARQFEQATASEISRLVQKNSHGKLKEDDYYPAELPNQAFLDQYGFSELKAMPVDTNKTTRLRQYNSLAAYPEMRWCIEEISRDFFRTNARGNVVELKLRGCDALSAQQQQIIRDEFARFVALFNLERNGEMIIRNYLTEGEICFENVIDPDEPEKGIIGVNYIPNRYFSFIVDQYGLDIKGIYVDKRIMKNDAIYGSMIGPGGGDGFGRARNVFNAVISTPAFAYTGTVDENMVPMPWSQVTYCNSCQYSDDKTIVYPMIDSVATPIRQLMLLHDAAVILRVTRAPQKLKFTLDGGKMPAKKIQEQLRKIANGLKSKKTATPDGEMKSSYDATTMLDAYFLWKTDDSQGLNLETFGETAKYNEMDDIEYFLRRILKLCHLPWTRWKTPETQSTAGSDTITSEELSHAKHIISDQEKLAAGIEDSFIVDLKLKKIWEDYGLTEANIHVEFVQPILWDQHCKTQEFTKKTEIVKTAIESKVMSRRTALKLCFDYDDSDVDREDQLMRKEILDDSVTEYFKAQLGKAGPKGMNSPIPYVGEMPQAPALNNMDSVQLTTKAPEANADTGAPGAAPEAGGNADMGGGAPMGGAPGPGPEGAPEGGGATDFSNLPPEAGGGEAGGTEPAPAPEPEATPAPAPEAGGETPVQEGAKPVYKTTDMSKTEKVEQDFDHFFNEKFSVRSGKNYENSEGVYGKKLADISLMDVLMRQAAEDGYVE